MIFGIIISVFYKFTEFSPKNTWQISVLELLIITAFYTIFDNPDCILKFLLYGYFSDNLRKIFNERSYRPARK